MAKIGHVVLNLACQDICSAINATAPPTPTGTACQKAATYCARINSKRTSLQVFVLSLFKIVPPPGPTGPHCTLGVQPV